MTDPVRAIAFHALRAVDERDAYVNLVLPAMLDEHHLEGRDAAFATELVHGTVRRQGTYDAIIRQVSGRDLASIDPPVLDALRLGAHQLLSMRVPAHAAVSTTVDVVRREIGHKPVGFVNALLRRIGAQDLDAWVEQVTEGLGPDEALAVRTSHPVWIVRALRTALGGHAAQITKLLTADNVPPRVTLVARPGLCEPESLPGTPGLLSPHARILDEGGDPGSIPEVRDGRAGVQDEGSQLVALALADAPLEGADGRWLDVCAGPGGKAALLGALARERGAVLVANEVQEHRAELVRLGVRRLDNVEVTVHDGRAGPWEAGSFDRVLVDAPCTGLGALRRRPESRWRRTEADLDLLVPLQEELLTRALELVRPGGVVVYATCSPHVRETTDVVTAVTGGRDDVSVLSTHQWWPHIDGTDAMFCALVRRSA
ncbi:putative ribosomal RNA small subunit methyltransferase B [Aeromicrobium marinum DSM 15272]|uniref:Ribosomal RNA small subunit methyltransferase B n=1 Tax=Aeromicrobium marinum DSM 15272 TaxID=585531 RepID=E2S9I0_9ACTN|nr:transcription antitermination factor NusB [Aeromicrobium marinum]EFQ83904.1 putative ribosomal RNA small subunit methyltransferase B [Aeromicrobium marinum DSM 15272]